MSVGPARHPISRARPAPVTVLAMALTLFVVMLHGVRALRASALWRDEAAAVRLATLPDPREINALFQHEAFPLLFPYLLRGYVAVAGASDAALRCFGFLVGLGLVTALWLNASVTVRSVPIGSLALVGFNLPVLIYGDSVRGYGLGAILILFVYGILAILLDERSPYQRYAFILLPLAAIASVQLVLGNAALLFALGIAAATMAALRRRWGLLAWILASGLAAGLSLFPYVRVLAGARRDWSVIVAYPFNIHRIWYSFLDALGRRLLLLSWLVLLGLGVGGVRNAMRKRGRLGARAATLPPEESGQVLLTDAGRAGPQTHLAGFAALVFLLAPLAYGVFLGVLGYRPRDWYYVPLIALLASSVDTLLAVGRPALPRWTRLIIAGALGIAAYAQAASLAHRLPLPATNVDRIASQLAATASANDLVIVTPWYYGVSFDRYYRGSAKWLTLPIIADHRIHRYDLLKRRLAADQPIADLLAAVATHLRAGHRVWVVGDFEPQPRGQTVTPMPRAPDSESGWHDYPYIVNWTRQLEVFIAGNAHQTTRVAPWKDAEVNGIENLSIFEVEGWDTRAATPESIGRR
jgi:hypothetical protein